MSKQWMLWPILLIHKTNMSACAPGSNEGSRGPPGCYPIIWLWVKARKCLSHQPIHMAWEQYVQQIHYTCTIVHL